MKTWAIILAAGQSSRLIKSGIPQKKQFLEFQGKPLFWHSVMTFAGSSGISGAVIAFPPDDFARCQDLVEDLKRKQQPGIPVLCVKGGALRQDSVFNGLAALPEDCESVLVHDAARPFFRAGLVHDLLDALVPGDGGVIPVIPCRDTVKVVRGNKVLSTLIRDEIALVQTPQFFPVKMLLDAHLKARQENFQVTDDASMVEKSGFTVRTVPGREDNIKITTREDLKMLEKNSDSVYPCTGFGYDVHRYGGPRPMVLGGIPIPGGPGVYAHSDGDVLFHALVDAILGCMGGGDIGDLFPDSEERFAGLSSSVFLSEVLAMALKENLELRHIDVTIIAQVPRVSPFKAQIKSNLMGLTGLGSHQVNVKATTEEKLGFTGSGQGIKAMAMVTAVKHMK
jgi:2-C-methyl-D-erythritol 4-phosphate cytidylyltransferase / 2-C-methyl-D-erythritol 2,4-cyclodiphosphate synthase